jgi:proteasome lid subunit RPN8/RPN11
VADEIEFGQVESARQLLRLRPDRNPQYAVVPCGAPAQDDLPIFVDLDTLRDMEAHALSDTRVELGGVLLGGQYEDEQDQPFVVIADALRARHYESTPGSFKFTHETWAEFTRQRAEMPAELQIVGWYHTHPKWGVFLSELDRFICEHFFGRPGDVALVIDPCQGDRGFFQWAGPAPGPTRRTGGFYVFASRHRAVELSCLVAYLENKLMPSHLPRTEGLPFPGIPYPVPLRPEADSRTLWHGAAVLGMLVIQFLFLALLAWKTLVPGSPVDGPGVPGTSATWAAAEPAGARNHPASEAEIQLKLLDRIVEELGQGTPQGLVRMLEQLQKENERLYADARVYRDLEAKVRAENEGLTRALADAEQKRDELTKRVADLRATIRDLEVARAERTPPESSDSSAAASVAAAWVRQPKAWFFGAAGVLAAGGLAWAALTAWKRQRQTAMERDSL